MNVSCDNITIMYDDEMIRELEDPLQHLDVYVEGPTYYRLDETVFAEPIAILNGTEINDVETDEAVSHINNKVVKKGGKKDKYFVDVSKKSLSPKCPQMNCNKTSTTTLLHAHMRRVHSAERNKYICECCAAGFSERYLLQRHMAVHSEDRTECPLCGKMLSKRTNMSIHLRRHSSARPHACQLCPRAFVRRATLNSHVRFVHRKGELRCRSCGEGFSSRKLLMNHKSCRLK